MSDRQQQMEEHARTQTESNAAAAAHQINMESQSRAVNKRKHNPQFYDKFTRSSLSDSRKWDWLTEEYAAWVADDHVLANRRQVHRLQRELLNKTRAEQAIAAGTPGVRLKEKPLLHALSQGIHVELDSMISFDAAGQSSVTITDEEYMPAHSASRKAAIDDFANVATARQSMGVEKAGSEALTTATSENRTVRENETEESGVVSSISGAFD